MQTIIIAVEKTDHAQLELLMDDREFEAWQAMTPAGRRTFVTGYATKMEGEQLIDYTSGSFHVGRYWRKIKV
jgi:hypothetical protein